jgi:hypothetical protein
LEQVVNSLLQKEEVFREDLEAILGPRPPGAESESTVLGENPPTGHVSVAPSM